MVLSSFNHWIFTYSSRGSIIVRLASCFTGLRSPKQVLLLIIKIASQTSGQLYSDTSTHKVSEYSQSLVQPFRVFQFIFGQIQNHFLISSRSTFQITFVLKLAEKMVISIETIKSTTTITPRRTNRIKPIFGHLSKVRLSFSNHLKM